MAKKLSVFTHQLHCRPTSPSATSLHPTSLPKPGLLRELFRFISLMKPDGKFNQLLAYAKPLWSLIQPTEACMEKQGKWVNFSRFLTVWLTAMVVLLFLGIIYQKPKKKKKTAQRALIFRTIHEDKKQAKTKKKQENHWQPINNILFGQLRPSFFHNFLQINFWGVVGIWRNLSGAVENCRDPQPQKAKKGLSVFVRICGNLSGSVGFITGSAMEGGRLVGTPQHEALEDSFWAPSKVPKTAFWGAFFWQNMPLYGCFV